MCLSIFTHRVSFKPRVHPLRLQSHFLIRVLQCHWNLLDGYTTGFWSGTHSQSESAFLDTHTWHAKKYIPQCIKKGGNINLIWLLKIRNCGLFIQTLTQMTWTSTFQIWFYCTKNKYLKYNRLHWFAVFCLQSVMPVDVKGYETCDALVWMHNVTCMNFLNT